MSASDEVPENSKVPAALSAVRNEVSCVRQMLSFRNANAAILAFKDFDDDLNGA